MPLKKWLLDYVFVSCEKVSTDSNKRHSGLHLNWFYFVWECSFPLAAEMVISKIAGSGCCLWSLVGRASVRSEIARCCCSLSWSGWLDLSILHRKFAYLTKENILNFFSYFKMQNLRNIWNGILTLVSKTWPVTTYSQPNKHKNNIWITTNFGCKMISFLKNQNKVSLKVFIWNILSSYVYAYNKAGKFQQNFLILSTFHDILA